MRTEELNAIRTEVKYKMTESAVRAEETKFPIMRQVYIGRSQAFEEVLNMLGEYETDC